MVPPHAGSPASAPSLVYCLQSGMGLVQSRLELGISLAPRFFPDHDFWSDETDVSWRAHLLDEVVFRPLVSGGVVFFHHRQCVLSGEEVAGKDLSYVRIHCGLVVDISTTVEY